MDHYFRLSLSDLREIGRKLTDAENATAASVMSAACAICERLEAILEELKAKDRE